MPAKNTKHSQTTVDRVLWLYRNGGKVMSIAARVGISKSSVCDIIRRHAPELARANGAKPKAKISLPQIGTTRQESTCQDQ